MRVVGRRVVVLAVVALQLGFAVRGYWSDHKPFAFQMFPESSTWRADVVRVTADGAAHPGRAAVVGVPLGRARAGPRAAATRRSATTRTPGSTTSSRSSRPRSTGSRSNTPRDRETRYLEATVTAWHNADPPRTEVLRSRVREGAR